jgi:hypothetical protein
MNPFFFVRSVTRIVYRPGWSVETGLPSRRRLSVPLLPTEPIRVPRSGSGADFAEVVLDAFEQTVPSELVLPDPATPAPAAAPIELTPPLAAVLKNLSVAAGFVSSSNW